MIQVYILCRSHSLLNACFGVFGASVTILKKGESASPEVREEAAAFAGAFSKAWERGASTVNVYALKREQVSKSKEKGSLGTGSFLLSGEREWHKNLALELAAFTKEEEEVAVFEVLGVYLLVLLCAPAFIKGWQYYGKFFISHLYPIF